MGKSTVSNLFFVQLPGAVTLIHDVKGKNPEYPATQQIANAAQALNMPIESLNASAVSFRGDPWRGIVCETEEVADLVLQLSRSGIRARLVIDELDTCVSESGRTLESDSVRLCFSQGRALGTDVIWGTQFPQRVPQAVCDLSSTIGIFRLGQRGLNYLDERLFFDPDMLATIPSLQPGEFVLRRPGRPWDRTVYKFDV